MLKNNNILTCNISDENNNPGICTAFEPNFKKCRELKKTKRGVDQWPCPHGPATGIARTCRGGGTRFQHVIHVKNGLKEFLKTTGIKKT